MKQTVTGLAQHYVTALRTHLKPGSRAGLRSALGLGRKAVALGLETLALARMHEHAFTALKLSARKAGALKRAELFFAEANTPIEETHRAARESKVCLSRMKDRLGRRTSELATSNRQLEQGVVQRRAMTVAFAKSGKHDQKCLQESLQLQKLLRELTHQAMAAQEDERKKISHELQDEIAQTLLGINVRLLSLKQNARLSTTGLKNEIASAQKLVLNSAKSVRRFARELKLHPPA